MTKKNIASILGGFLTHHADEMRLLATGLGALASRFMDHDDQAKLSALVDRFNTGADNIQNSIDLVRDAATPSINPKELRKMIDDAMPGLIADAVNVALASREKSIEEREQAFANRIAETNNP